MFRAMKSDCEVRAKILHEFLSKNNNISYEKCLDAIAYIYNHKNWESFCAWLDERQSWFDQDISYCKGRAA